MTKAGSEPAIRQLVSVWAAETGFDRSSGAMPSFYAFKAWLHQKGYSHYLDFRSAMGAEEDAERWFDQELGQTWRN